MCLQPITLKPSYNKHDGEFHSLQVPCGKCLECKIQYQNHWFVRMYQEAKNHRYIIFFTLTYRERIIPYYKPFNESKKQKTCPYYKNILSGEKHRTVLKKHVQDWLKRFRTNLERSKGKRIWKYFITSEYGPRTLRPHYHGVMFGLNADDFQIAYEDWMDTYGNVEFSVIKQDSVESQEYREKVFRYVSKYCSKGVFENPKVEKRLVDKTFHLISKKIGYSYIPLMREYHLARDIFPKRIKNHQYKPEYLEYIIKNRKVQIGDFKYSMPRYYRNYIYGEQSNLSYQMSKFIQSQFDRLYLQKLASLSTQMSPVEATHRITLTNLADIEFRRSKAHRQLERFYDKSKI